jgi:HK97 family phage portal protein
VISSTIGALPLPVFRRGRDGVAEQARDSGLWRVLHDSPNADQTALDFIEFVCASLELQGHAYSVVERTGGKVVALSPPIAPELMTVRRLNNGEMSYRWSDNGRERTATSTQMLHIRGPLGGLSTLAHARRTFGLASAIERAATSTFRNGVRPSIAVETDQKFNPDQVRDFRSQIAENYQGTINSGQPFLAHGGVKVKEISINPEDAQMLQSRAFSVEEICRFFGVPPFMVGHTEKSTSWGTGLEQQMRMFYVLALRRRLERIEQALKKQLLTPRDRVQGIEIEFNVEGLLRGDSKSRAEFYASGLQNGWRTINEVRALENLPPVEGGDVPRMQMQNVPITEAGQIVRP